jgi:hypothetical protein
MILVVIPSQLGPFGAKVVGEPHIVPVSADTDQLRLQCGQSSRYTTADHTRAAFLSNASPVDDSQIVLAHERIEVQAQGMHLDSCLCHYL